MTISAKIIADSISDENTRITTFELEYPRFIHAEFMTHRLFSRNAQSSRAVPVKKQLENIRNNPAMPSHWGKNQSGMSAKEECNEFVDVYGLIDDTPSTTREQAWDIAKERVIDIAKSFADAGYHKQIVNRLTEPFAHIKVVCTATEYDNFFWLRKHPDAQPEIQELAKEMWEARNKSTPVRLGAGDWHVPYFNGGNYFECEGTEFLQEALMISSSCCAQVSYRALDDSLEKARKIYNMLVEAEPPHFSPFEHQATPMSQDSNFDQAGVTHRDSRREYWSGNFRGWIQHRQRIMVDKGLETMSCRKL